MTLPTALRSLLAAHASRSVSAQHRALAELLRVARTIQEPRPVEVVERDGWTVALDSGAVMVRLRSEVLTLEAAEQLVADLEAVIAAGRVG